MKILPLIFLTVLGHSSIGQRAEFSEIHSENDDATSLKLHVKEVLPFEGRSVEEIKDIIAKWYSQEVYYKKLVYRYTFSWTNGQNEWKQSRDYLPGQDSYQPYDANTDDRVLTAHIKCKDCFIAYKNGRRKNDGYYKLDFRIKEGKILLVMFEPFDISANAWLSLWLVKNKQLVKRPDKRLDAIEEQFQKVKASLIEFALDYDGSPHYEPRGKPTKKSIDDW